jgi:hypothetical protein
MFGDKVVIGDEQFYPSQQNEICDFFTINCRGILP